MSSGAGNERQKGNSKEKDVRMSNIVAAKAVADAVRTSLGPRGMDKMIQKGEVSSRQIYECFVEILMICGARERC
jgi:chaperonin GroEL (HSP60 family)